MIDYDPQIPELTPTSLKNQGVLQRITDHLRSLTLYGGEGVRLDRQGYGTRISVEPTAGGGGGGGETYGGFFIVSAGTAEDTVDISAGKVINGTTTTSVAAEEAVATIGSLYIFLEVWYTSSWQTMYGAEATYPTQEKKGDYYAWRVLIASRKDTDSSWDRQVCGELHNPRVMKQ